MEARLLGILPSRAVVRISHIGSTAVAGIWAKPIVDVLVEIEEGEEKDVVVRLLERSGFLVMSSEERRASLNAGYTEDGFADEVFHIHLRFAGDNDELYFRDFLNDHPETAKEYEALKLGLWHRFEHDRDGYTQAKGDFGREWVASSGNPAAAPRRADAGSAAEGTVLRGDGPDRRGSTVSRTRNMLDYVRTELDTFDGRGFCTVDSLVLSWLAYTRLPADDPALAPARGWEGVRLADLYRAEYFATYYAGMWGEEPGLDLLAAVAASPRFRDVRVMGYVDATDPRAEKQFAAMTFRLTEDLSYVAFRGTDASLVGWKEDFNLAYRCPVPSQVEAAHYLADAAARVGGDLLVGGHSKGGNLAVYAAATAPRDASGRVTRIFSHDGPGFLAEFLATEDYRRVEGRVEKTLPQSSVVGMLLEQQEGYRVVRSNRAMIWQHDPFSWVVEGCDLVTLDGLTADARYLNRTVSAWLGSRTVEERERFIDTLYSVIDLGDVSTTHELRADWRRSIHVRARAFAGLDAETRSFVTQTLTALVSLGVRVVPDLLVEDLQRVRSGTSAAALGA